MLITQIEIAHLRIPLIRPFITALRRTEHVEDIVVIIKTASGVLGYGAAASTPVITGDSQESIIGALKIIAAKLIGKTTVDFEELLLTIQNSVVNNPSAKAALDIALHDLVAKSMHQPLYKFLGGGKPELKILTTVSVKAVTEMVEDAQLFVAQGFETLKIKVGLNPAEDIQRLKAIREAVGDSINILSDANQGWDAKSALQIIDSLAAHNLGIAMVEQPVKAWDYANLKYVRDNSRIPIYDLATSHNLPCMAGCMLESPIGLAAMAAFVVGKSNIKFVDLDPIAMIKSNPVVGGVRLDGATLHLSTGAGLGIENIQGLIPVVTIGA